MSTMEEVTIQRNSLHYPLNTDGEDMERELQKPFMHLTLVPGKKIRLDLVKVLEHWTTVTEDKVSRIRELTHYMHNASLLADDIQDYSNLRRCAPTAHKVYGIPRTMQSVDWVRSHIFELFDQFQDIKLTKIYTKATAKIIAGQGMELYWRDNHICPTEAEYLQMVYRKTGVMLLTIHDLMNACSTPKQVDATKLLSALGIYLQINDDYQNLQSQVYFDSKGFCEDLSEGKFSYPIIHAIKNFPKEGKIIMNIIGNRSYDVQLKKYCLSILEKCGSFEYTRKKLKELKAFMDAEIAMLGENPVIHEFIEKSTASAT